MGHHSRRGARIAAVAAAFTLVLPVATQAFAAPEVKLDDTVKSYIVQLASAPIATYSGGQAGIPATAPAKGQKVNPSSSNAKAYAAHLRNQQRQALKAAKVAESAKTSDYTVAFNGFSAKMTSSQAAELAKTPGVVNVWQDEVRYADTVTTPDYLGLSGKSGVWAQQFGGDQNAGKGIIVGVIDTGIDPNNPSFAAIKGGTARPANYVCATENDPTFACTNKIVGARYYGAAYGNNINYDFNSPRDTNGHGSHTAGTSAGNHGVNMTIMGNDMGNGSGMAPAAQIAVYKGLWQTADGRGSGTTAGLVKAIDDAVADGVDVINYSVSGSSTYVVGPDELAFFSAAEAGIFVSTSAGNSGDTVGVSSVAHNAPWTMTVAASTHNRGAEKTVTLGNGAVYPGVGVGGAVGPAPTVLASAIGLPGVSAQAVRECWLDADTATAGVQPTLDPAKAAGKIVVCDRGTVARVDKSAAVKLAGGIGMIQVNMTDAQSLNADFHSVPSIHVNATNGAAIKSYVGSTANATSTISAVSTEPVDAPSMAGFSSYGPALAGDGDLLKPDITAPGVDVIAAYSADASGKARFDSLSGTSMSAPHIAGLAALMKQKFPTWSPMAIKSAMMTTARQTTDKGLPIQWAEGDATPLNFGSGEVVPAKAYNPGLVYDSTPTDWLTYTCAIGQLQMVGGADTCAELPKKDPSDLNYPSISIGKLAGTQTITRTVTNVNKSAMQYRAKVEAPAGMTVKVVPDKITLTPYSSATFKVTITNVSAPLNEYSFGAVTWVPNSPKYVDVRSPIAVKPVAIAATEEVVGSGVAGNAQLPVTAGYTGTLNTDVDGLLASTVTTLNVTRNPATVLDGYTIFQVAAGTRVTRVATYADQVNAADIDLNVYRFNANGTISAVGSSGNDGSTEAVTLRDLPPGMYVAAVDVYSPEATARVPLHIWNVGDQAAGNLTVAPASQAVTLGGSYNFTAAWQGLDATKKYLGMVNYVKDGSIVGSTIVTVNP